MVKKDQKNQISRPPVVVVLGHVDHGKSSILEAIKDLKITAKESGGITQHIGAYEVEHQNKKITFIDTPGHEAFSAIRSRGAKVADIAILVVAADEGVKAQTIEAISHAKKAQISIIVSINKTDKPEANPEKVKRELASQDVLVESMGGEIPSVEVSAKTGQGISELLELILLVAEMEDLKTDISKAAEGVIIESYLDNLRGPTATIILQNGILKKGDILGTSSAFGKIRILENFQGEPMEEVFPSMPAIIIGFESVPGLGENFRVFATIDEAKKNIKTTSETLPEKILIEPGTKVLNLILKVDVLGSLEAIKGILEELPQEKPSTKAKLVAGPVPHRPDAVGAGAGVILRIVKGEVGDINESDVKLAKGAKATVVGFRVKVNPIAKNLAIREKIRIKNFDVIYDLVQTVRDSLEKMIEPEIVRTDLGKIKILVVFRTEKNRQIIGGKVIEGKVKKGTMIDVCRNEEKIGKGKIIGLQRDKKDIEEVIKGSECGILYEGNIKIEEGDILEVFYEERRKIEL